MTRFLFTILLGLFLTSCTNNDEQDPERIQSTDIWFDYRIWGEEESGYITVKLQFRYPGRAGKSLLVAPPGRVELDGDPLPADSSEMNGIYYEITRPIQEFAGLHTIRFTDKNNKLYEEKFEFEPFTLEAEPGGQVTSGQFQLQVSGAEPTDRIRVILMDTASFSEGIDRLDSAKDGIVMIDSTEMATLAEGPVFLELSRETERRLREGDRTRGRLSMSFRLRRQFDLIRTK